MKYKEQIYKQGHRRARRTKPVNEKSGQNERRCYSTAIRPAYGFDSKNARYREETITLMMF
ncbi:MAG: hypothetical protein ACJ71R_07210 [Nitrososphaeraceae archaeon]